MKKSELADVIKLKELQDELRILKQKEMKLRKDIAHSMVPETARRHLFSAGRDGVHVEISYPPKLVVTDKDELMDYVDDDTLPEGTVLCKADITASRAKQIPDDHEIWSIMYMDVSDTPTVKITFDEDED